jgi:predicted nucleic acid-binding protein
VSPKGAPARTIRPWIEGAFELVVSPLLLAEVERALGYPKLRRYLEPGEVRRVLALLGAARRWRTIPSRHRRFASLIPATTT